MKRIILLALSLIAFTVSQQITAEDAKTELEGTWELVSLERDGEDVKIQKDTRSIITGNKFQVKVGDNVISGGTVKLDPSKKPKAVDTTYTEGPDKGKTYKGIYEINGDMAKFCRPGSPEKERPAEFKTKPDSGATVFVYKRVKS